MNGNATDATAKDPNSAPMDVDGDNGGPDDDSDPVVHEIPVFIAKSLQNNLYLFQYPVRPAHMSYDTSTVVQSRVRPGNQQVELSLALNADGPNFDVSKGEQMALNVDGCDEKPGSTKRGGGGGGGAFGVDADPDDKLFSSGIMDKQVLVSTKANLDASRYAVGILGSNEFHVTPLSSVLHLRPDLKYLDKSDKTAKAEGRTLDDPDDPAAAAAAGGAGAGQDAPELRPVTVRFSKSGVQGDAAKKHREKSYEYQMKKAEEEPWRVTRFHHVKSSRWEDETQLLFCRKMDEEATALNRSDATTVSGGQAAKEYLRNLTS